MHQPPQWPEFRWDHEVLETPLASLRHRQGRLIRRMEGLGFSLRSEAVLQTLTEDVMKSSEIEWEKLERDQVRSSIARRLGMLDRQGANRRENAISLTVCGVRLQEDRIEA